MNAIKMICIPRYVFKSFEAIRQEGRSIASFLIPIS
jgi:hypothetical protein